MSTKASFDFNSIQENIKLLETYELNIFIPQFGFIRKTSEFSKKHNVSVYDASYAVLAMEKKCELITADEKFVKQVNLDFIKSLREYSL